MNKKNTTWYQMMTNVVSLANDNQSIVDLIISFKNGILALAAKTAGIFANEQTNSLPITGAYSNKNEYKVNLSTITFAIISRVKAYAISQNDDTLKKQVSFSFSALMRMSFADLIFAAQQMHNIIVPLIPQLTDYSITIADMQSMQTSIDNLKNINTTPRQEIINKVKNDKALDKLIREGLAICNDTLDPISIGFTMSGNTDFFNAYKSARKLVPHGNTHTKFEITAINDVTGNPIPLATVSLDGTGLSRTTNINGHAIFEEAPVGIFKCTVSHPDYASITSPEMQIKKGKKTKFTASMVPSFTIPAPQETPQNQNA